jgi:hypothetical protein
VLNDPVNFVDPLGLAEDPEKPAEDEEEIIVTALSCATNPAGCPAKFVPSEFLADWEFFNLDRLRAHHYEFVHDLTKKDTQCSLTQASQAVRSFAVPGNDGTQVKDKQTYTVKQSTPFVVPVVNSLIWLNVPVGQVRVDISSSGNRITNTTLSGHIFHTGKVSLTILGAKRGGYSLHVVGSGTNYSPAHALVNKLAGPPSFKNQVAKMRAHLKKTCGG